MTTRKRVSLERFVTTYMQVWAKGGAMKDVAKALSRSQSSVSNRVKKLRDCGVDLPILEHGREKLDYIALNKIVEEHGGNPQY
jgi:predicted transcriptional regulator